MRIVMLTSSYPKYAGETTAPFIEEIAAGLVRRGHEVEVIAPFHPQVRRQAIERGVQLTFFRYAPHPRLNIYGYAESLKADIGLRGAAMLAAPLAVSAGFISMLRARKPDIVHAHWVLPNGVPAAFAAALRHRPLVVSLHGSDVFLAERATPLSLTARSVFQYAAQSTACSRDLATRAVRLGAPAERMHVIPYGVDVSAFQPAPDANARVRAELGLPSDAKLVISIGRLVYKKGLTYLIEAFPAIRQRHPQAVLIIGGYGDLRQELETQAQRLGIADAVIFPGQLERERVAQYIAAADVYVVPSIRDQKGNMDGLPNVLLEGMAAGRPIVASAIAGIPDVIHDRVHGVLTPERNPTALSQAITTLLDNPTLAQQLGQQARARVTSELTWDVTAERFEQVYLRVQGGARGT